MVDYLECKEDILPLFDNEDVLLEERDFVSSDDDFALNKNVYIRPSSKFNDTPKWDYLLKIEFDEHNVCKRIFAAKETVFDSQIGQVVRYGEIPIFILTKTIILTILSDYNTACEKYKKYYKNKKIAEIRGICDKFTV